MTRLRLDIAALRRALGEKAFARGEAYFDNDLIEVIGIDHNRVFATAFGSETYGVELVAGADGRDISGRCTCPACEDWGVCKHLAATALTVEAMTAEEVDNVRARHARLRAGLRVQGIDALIDVLVGLAARDPDLLEALERRPRGEDGYYDDDDSI